MKPRRDPYPYWFSADESVNASLSLGKLRKRLAGYRSKFKYRPASRYQVRLSIKQSARRIGLRKNRP